MLTYYSAHYKDKVLVNVDEVILLIQDAISIPNEVLLGRDVGLDTRLVVEGLKCFSVRLNNPFPFPKPKTMQKTYSIVFRVGHITQ